MEEGVKTSINIGISLVSVGAFVAGSIVIGGIGYGIWKGKEWVENKIAEEVAKAVEGEKRIGVVEERGVRELEESVGRVEKKVGELSERMVEIPKEILKIVEKKNEEVYRKIEKVIGEKAVEINGINEAMQDAEEGIEILGKQSEANSTLIEKSMGRILGTIEGNEDIVVRLQDAVERLIEKLITSSINAEQAEGLREILMRLVEING